MLPSKIERALSKGLLTGRSAFVLGAGSGIGRAVAEAFVDEGARVIALEVSADKCAALSAELPAVRVIEGNACRRTDVGKAVAACAKIASGLDVLVNCVGIFDFYKDLGEIDPEKLAAGFDDIFRVNVLSGLVATQACLSMLRAAKGTVILDVVVFGLLSGTRRRPLCLVEIRDPRLCHSTRKRTRAGRARQWRGAGRCPRYGYPRLKPTWP